MTVIQCMVDPESERQAERDVAQTAFAEGPEHLPAGSPKGGQFAPKGGGGNGTAKPKAAKKSSPPVSTPKAKIPESDAKLANGWESAFRIGGQLGAGDGLIKTNVLHREFNRLAGADISPETFKGLLVDLSKKRLVELKVLNEVRMLGSDPSWDETSPTSGENRLGFAMLGRGATGDQLAKATKEYLGDNVEHVKETPQAKQPESKTAPAKIQDTPPSTPAKSSDLHRAVESLNKSRATNGGWPHPDAEEKAFVAIRKATPEEVKSVLASEGLPVGDDDRENKKTLYTSWSKPAKHAETFSELLSRFNREYADKFAEGDSPETPIGGSQPIGTPRMARLNGVEIFSTGIHRGKPYSHQDLRDIVGNFNKFSVGPDARVQPPFVIGHEEHQELMDNTGIPRMGEPDKLWKEDVKCRLCDGTGENPQAEGQPCPMCLGTKRQGILKADLQHVPESIAKLIAARAYNGISSEIYPQPPVGVPGTGPMLRRIAALGGELPQIKTLKDLPWPDYEAHSEKGESEIYLLPAVVRLASVATSEEGTWLCFSEVSTMPFVSDAQRKTVMAKGKEGEWDPTDYAEEGGLPRDEMVKKLAESGYKPEVLEKMPDEHLRECARMADMASKGGVATPGSPDDLQDVGGWEGCPAQEGAKKFMAYRDSMMKKFREYGRSKFGEHYLETDVSGKPKPEADKVYDQVDRSSPPATFSERTVEAIVKKVLAKNNEGQHRKKVESFVESRRQQGLISAPQLDKPNGKPNIIDRLLSLDDTVAVYKFKERSGRTVERTALELAMDEIDAGTPAKYSEKAGQPVNVSRDTEDREKDKVAQHWESYAEEFSAIGTTKTEFVDAFVGMKKMDPTITADKYVNIGAGRGAA